MTATPQATPHCAVCGSAVAADAPRCPACGLSLPAANGARVLGRRGLWAIVAVLAAVYVVVLLIVAAAK
jgi:predicted nucleic acid-binding Zn ribbon protein